MNEQNQSSIDTTRREVIKTSGAIGGINLLGISSRINSTSPTHLIELCHEFDLMGDEDESTISVLHFDSAPPYQVDRKEGRLVTNPYSNLSEETISKLETSGFAIRRGTQQSGRPVAVAQAQSPQKELDVDKIPRTREPDYRASYQYRLAESTRIKYPEIVQSGRDAVARLGGSVHPVGVGEELSINLEKRVVKFKTMEVKDTKIKREGVPSEQRPLKKETGVMEAEITPIVKIRNLGELTVERGEV